MEIIDNAGGGTASSMCAISNADTVGTLDNLINRIEKLETAVMQLLTANTKANQLSDLSQQVGWVGGVTFMGVSGWTQTEYGTMIPPAGWSLLDSGLIPTISGTGMQLLYTDADGNIFSADDFVGGAPDYILFDLLGGVNESRGITNLVNTFSLAAGVTTGSYTARVSKAGLYLVEFWGVYDAVGAIPLNSVYAGDTTIQVTGPDAQLAENFTISSGNQLATQNVHEPSGSYAQTNVSHVIKAPASSIISIQSSVEVFGTTPGSLKTGNAHVGIVRLGSLG